MTISIERQNDDSSSTVYNDYHSDNRLKMIYSE